MLRPGALGELLEPAATGAVPAPGRRVPAVAAHGRSSPWRSWRARCPWQVTGNVTDSRSGTLTGNLNGGRDRPVPRQFHPGEPPPTRLDSGAYHSPPANAGVRLDADDDRVAHAVAAHPQRQPGRLPRHAHQHVDRGRRTTARPAALSRRVAHRWRRARPRGAGGLGRRAAAAAPLPR